MGVTVGLVSLGCPKNQVDAEILLSSLVNEGFTIEDDPAMADVAIINTCGFIEAAKAESIENILEYGLLKKDGQVKHIVVTGCLAERYKDDIAKELPEADIILGIGSNNQLIDAIKQITNKGGNFYSFDDKYNLPLEGDRVLLSPPYTAYLKIAEGCSNGCSYCAIPLIRGKFRSREMQSILEEARTLAKNGVKEVVIVAQDTSRYGEDIYGESRLPELLESLAMIEEFRWIRILYCYPERITDRLLRVISENDNIVKYLDIPIQHSNGRILKEMNRKGDEDFLSRLVFNIRKKIPDVTLRTTLIVGFPGETDEEFEELSEFVKRMRFDRLGCFAYSIEEGTKAAKMDDQLDERTKNHRAELINQMQYDISLSKNKKLVGQRIEVLVEGYDRFTQLYFGRSEADSPEIDFKIFFSSKKPLKPGDFVDVSIEKLMETDPIGVAE